MTESRTKLGRGYLTSNIKRAGPGYMAMWEPEDRGGDVLNADPRVVACVGPTADEATQRVIERTAR